MQQQHVTCTWGTYMPVVSMCKLRCCCILPQLALMDADATTIMQILPLCYLHLFAASCSYSCTQDGHCATCAGGAFSSTNKRKYSSCSHGRHHLLQLALVVFILGVLVHLLMCARTNRHTLQLALCGGGFWWCIQCKLQNTRVKPYQ